MAIITVKKYFSFYLSSLILFPHEGSVELLKTTLFIFLEEIVLQLLGCFTDIVGLSIIFVAITPD